MTRVESPWLALDGTANTRDVGGVPARGGLVRRGLLLRSDNLQELTPADVRVLADHIGVRTVLDLRTDTERASEGPGPLTARSDIAHLALSFIPDADLKTTAGNVVLPDRWAAGAANAYLHYMRDRPESFAAAVTRLAAPAAGAVVVHCAAGKDRTGVLIALVLDTLGVDRELICADYARTNDRIEQIFARLERSPTYRVDVRRIGLDAHRVVPTTMVSLLGSIDSEYGGSAHYLAQAGVTESALANLTHRLVEPS